MKNNVMIDTLNHASENGLLDDFGLNVARSRVKGHKLVHRYGRNADIDAIDVFETLWNGGGIYTGFDAIEAQTVDVSSSSTDDNATGIGARIITLYGLDADFKEINETITLNGTIAVTSQKLFIRCDRAKVNSAGSAGSNQGVINISQSTSGIVFAAVPELYNSTMIAAYTIPAGKTAYVRKLFATFAGGKKAAYSNLKILIRPYGEVFQVNGEASLHSEGSSSLGRDIEYSIKIAEKSDVHIIADTSEIGISVAAAFDMLLVDNNL